MRPREPPRPPSDLSWEPKPGRTAVPSWPVAMALNSLPLANSSSGMELAFRNFESN